MYCVLEITAMKDKVVCVPSECGKDFLSPFFKPTYVMSLGRHDTKINTSFCVYILYTYIYIYLYIFLFIHTHTHTNK